MVKNNITIIEKFKYSKDVLFAVSPSLLFSGMTSGFITTIVKFQQFQS